MKSKLKVLITSAVWISSLLSSTFDASAVSVTLQVDMSVQIARGWFNPGPGDTVEARGDFNGWSGGFTLTNSPDNTNIFVGTCNDTNTPGSQQQYKFVRINGGNATWEGNLTPVTGNNRSFTLANSPQILPPVYFDNLAPDSGVPTHAVTFQVDMTVQITNGNFFPEFGDTVQVRGTFQTPNQWTSGFVLTNDPAGANTNLYSGTYLDANYPGTQEAYKFVNVSLGFGDKWETCDNRPFTVQTNAQTLPVVYFNNQPGSTVPVTFQVDLTPQVLLGRFNPGADLVEARGPVQFPATWTGGFVLTNNPAASNTNLYSGTYVDFSAPGTVDQYKFVVNGGGGPVGWEQPLSTAKGNRSFVVSNAPQVLAPVYFSDLALSDMLAEDTWVTFRVNMTNAVGIDSLVFDPATNIVCINGDFLGWWGWGMLPPEYVLTNNPIGSKLYSITLLVPKGNPVALTYKYSIDGLDNEAPFKVDHVRYVRSFGICVLPLDTFGNQLIEASFGDLKAEPAPNGCVRVSWLGRPGVHLQSSEDLNSGLWQDHVETDGLSSTNWPIAAGARFFRLVKPN